MAGEPNHPQEYLHIPFEREPDFEPERRRRRAIGPNIPQRDPQQHGRLIGEESENVLRGLTATRRAAGITPDRLVVFEFNSWDPNARDVLEERFAAVVVDETLEKINHRDRIRVLVQFPTAHELDLFNRERERYERGDETQETLPPGLRRRFFDAIEKIRSVEPEERKGSRLRVEGWPAQKPFYIDVDLWHPGSVQGAREILDELRTVCQRYDGRVTDDTRTSTLLLARVQANQSLGEALLQLDIVARVDLPPKLPTAYTNLFDQIEPLPIVDRPTDQDPIAAVLDSGVLPGHPLLQGWVIEERDFDTGEGTPVDLHGHGTQVAGLVAYGDVAKCLETKTWRPKVRICSGKVLRCDPYSFNPDIDPPVFPENRRPEAVIEEAIRYFHSERGCRVFNLSLGNAYDIYNGGRQFPWAEKLDQLAKELDIVIVIAAGNRTDLPIPDAGFTRDQFQKAVRDRMLVDVEQRLCNPATAAIAVTIGAITRSANPYTRDAIAAVPENVPSPFSRVGPGYQAKDTQRAVKPEFVAYGGSYALQSIAGGEPRWVRNDLHLGEPTLRLPTDDGRVVSVATGTSFACPHVTHAAAIAERRLFEVFGQSPSANAVRAVLGACTTPPDCEAEWIYNEENKETWEKLQLVGYGICLLDRVAFSRDHDVCLIAEDELPDDRWHIYALPVPQAFLSDRGKRGITVAMAYDPPVRSGRREYLARTMWVEMLKGMTADEIERCRSRHSGEGDAPSLPASAILDLRPTKEPLQWSTIQVRRRIWARAPRFTVIGDSDLPILHVVVGCQHRFATGEDTQQRYALALRLWHESERVRVYQQLQQRVRARVVERIRVREGR